MDNLKLTKAQHVVEGTMRDIWGLASIEEKFLAVSFLLLLILRPGFKENYCEFVKSDKC